jgi:hypothetical protein
MNCIVCIEQNLKNQLLNDAETVATAVDGARTAVTIRNGRPLCVEHLHETLVGDAVVTLNYRSKEEF